MVKNILAKIMKHYKYLIVLFMSVSILTGCLKKGLPDFENWDLNNIDNIYVEHRYETDRIMNGQPVVDYRRLDVKQTVDPTNATIDLEIVVPQPTGSFTSEIRDNVSQNHLWMYMDISTAAKITPLGDSPQLGDPIDLTKEHQYQVTAANGEAKVWKIKVISFQK